MQLQNIKALSNISALILLALVFVSVNVFAQQNSASAQQRSPLDATAWGVVYDIPATKNVKLTPDVTYFKDARSTLTIDVYSPPDLKANEKRPAVVFLNAIGDNPVGQKVKHWEIYKSFPRLMAAHGLVGISMEADGTRIQENLRSLFEFLAKEGDKHGIDGSKIGIYAASANVTQSSRFLLADGSSPNVKAAVLYYGGAPEPEAKLRTDLPVLFILTEGDAPRLGQSISSLWQRVMEAKAPWTLMYVSRMPHAFDVFTDSDDSRRIIQQTIAFWKSHLEPVPKPDWQPSPAREIVESGYWNDPQRTADLLTKYLVDNSNDVQGHSQLGRALLTLRKYDEAVASYERALKIAPDYLAPLIGIGQIRYSQKRYEEAIQFLSKGIAGGFQNSLIYGQLAFSQLALNRNEEAIKSYEKAFEMGIPPGAATRGTAYYNMASGYTRLKQNDKAFEMLNKAIDENFNNRATFENDTDLAPLRTDARFQNLLTRLPKNSN